MAIRNLRLEGDEILKKKSREVETIDDKLQILIDDMIETMHKYNGVGLAAVQVGILKRLVVIDIYDDNGPIVLINPVILKTKGARKNEETACPAACPVHGPVRRIRPGRGRRRRNPLPGKHPFL